MNRDSKRTERRGRALVAGVEAMEGRISLSRVGVISPVHTMNQYTLSSSFTAPTTTGGGGGGGITQYAGSPYTLSGLRHS